MPETLKQQTIKGTVWSTIEKFSVQAVSFIIMIFMARVLTPEDYGLVGMVTIFIAISQSLVDSGFSQALIRKQNRTETDNSTVFWFNMVTGVIIYFIMFFCAPVIAIFYNEPLLIPITRFISLSIIINSLVVVQRAILTSNLDFQSQAKASLTATILGGALGLSLAYTGFGVWSIVWYQIANLGINILILWIVTKWYPRWIFSWNSFKELFNFGSKLAASGIISTLYTNIYLLVIGKVFKASDLGYYTRAQQFAAFPSSNITSILQRVTYPVFCKIQDERERLTISYRQFLRVSGYIIFPLMVGLAVLAKPIVLVVLKPDWEFAAVLLSILCFALMWYPIHAINLNLLQVTGRSDLFLKLEIWKKVVGVAILCATVPIGLIAMCVGQIFSSLISLGINTYYTGKLINLGFWKQMKDLLPALTYSLCMGLSVYAFILLIESEWLKIIVGFSIGLIVYLGLSHFTDSKDLKFILELFNSFIRKKTNTITPV